MHVLNTAQSRNPFIALTFALGILLASCGGEGGAPVGTAPTGTVASPAAPATVATGRLTVTVTDPDGGRLANAMVWVNNTEIESDQNGMATFDRVPAAVMVSASHPLGQYRRTSVEVGQTGTTSVTAVVQPMLPTTAALYPATIPAGSPSPDRTEIDVRFSLVSSVSAPFVRSVYGSSTNANSTPVLTLKDCTVWLDSPAESLSCRYDSWEGVQARAFAYHPSGNPLSTAAQGPFSALLLLDQSRRARDYDSFNLRTFAAKRFVRRARATPQADLIAVAGFAGPGGDASSPPLLQRLPLWAPPNAASVFSSDRFAQLAALDVLQPLVGGSAPVFEALGAAMTLTSTHASAIGRRAIVALLGGGDDSGLTEVQRRIALASLRQQQADTGIQVILITARLSQDSVERRNLAELAAALRAPIIFAGYPGNFRDQTDGLFPALDLAADMLAGTALPTIDATFRMKSNQPDGYRSGSILHGTVRIESDQCPMGCWELPQDFAVEIP